MNDFKELEGEVLDSIILSENKDQLVFRLKSGWLVFYRGQVTSVLGFWLLDDKYSSDTSLDFDTAYKSPNGFTIRAAPGDYLTIDCSDIIFEGKVLESVLKDVSGFEQLMEDF